MTRFGNLTAKFYAKSNLLIALSDTGSQSTRVPVSGSTEAFMNGTGRTELIFAADSKLFDLVVAGRICAVTYADAIAPGVYTDMLFCLPFEIENIEPLNDGKVRVEGPDLLEALQDRQLFEPIGSATNTATTVAVAVADPITTTVGVGAPTNNDSVTMTDATGFQVGDEVRIEMDGGTGTHVTVVTSVNPPLAPTHTIQIRDRLPYNASNGNNIERRRRHVEVDTGDGAAFQIGVECRLVMDNGSTHTTLIEEAPDGDVVVMRDGAPDGAAIGKAITATDYSTPATNDVSVIVGKAQAWAAEFESGSYYGTAAGTYHAPQGESVYDLLVATAQRSGEFFRLKDQPATGLPVRRVLWRRTFDYAGYGGNLRLVKPGIDDIDNEALNYNRGIIVGEPRRTGVYMPITRVIPYAGDKRITLDLCSEGAKLTAQAMGYDVVTTGLGLYNPPYVVNTAAETSLGLISRTVTFSEIRVETNKVLEWRSAADELLKSTVAFLQEHGTAARYQYDVPDVVVAVPVLPGQRVEMVYTAPDGSWSVNRTGANALYVLSVSRRFGPPQDDGQRLNAGGVPLTTLVLVESPYDIPDTATAAAGAINEVGRLARQSGGGLGGGSSSTTVVTGGTASDHGALTGLNDDDHPRYLLADGTRVMTGDLALEEGKRVDGIDISAHAADPAAHHAPVTPGNTGIFVAGQQVGVWTATPSAVEVVDGVRLAATAAGSGLQLVTQVLSIRLATNSGLSLANGTLALGTPGGLTAVTANAVTATGHTHSVAASADPGATTQLLKTNESGHLRLFSLSIGVAADSVSSLKVMSSQPTWYGLLLKQRSDQSAQMLRIESATGGALLMVTNSGDLESGNPGFVSGLTGWQISAQGDAEFNNVRVRGELHATTFVADEMHATGGTIQVATATNIAEPWGSYQNRLGPVDTFATTYITVNASWSNGLCYFAQKDIIRIKSMGEVQNGGSLYIPDIYLEVVAVSSVGDRNLGQGNPGRYALMCLRKSGGYEGYTIPTGSAVVLWTKSGQAAGTYKGNMLLTADLAQSPYLDVFTVDASRAYLAPWPGSGQTRTPPTVKPRVRVGNLDGVLGLPEQWGIAAGTDLSDTSTAAKSIVASNLGVTLRNVDLSMYKGADRVINVSPAGIEIQSSNEAYEYERTIRWQRPSGALVAAISALGDGTYTRLDIGVTPTFNQPDMTENGLHIRHLLSRPYGDLQHRVELYGWGVIDIASGHHIQLSGPYVTTSPLRVNGALVVGDITVAPSSNGSIYLKERTATVSASSGFGAVWIQNVSGVQKLYVKFANGVVRELATA